MVQWIKRLQQYLYTSTQSEPRLLHASPAPCYCTWKGITRWPEGLGLFHPHGRLGWCSSLLTSAWSSLGHCCHLENDQWGWRDLSHLLFIQIKTGGREGECGRRKRERKKENCNSARKIHITNLKAWKFS